MATAFDLTGGGTTSTNATPRAIGTNVLTSRIINLSGTTTGDTWTVIDLPAGHTVLDTKVCVVEDAGATATFNVGHATSAAAYASAVNVSQAAGTVIVGTGNHNLSHVAAATSVVVAIASGSAFTAGKFYVQMTVAA